MHPTSNKPIVGLLTSMLALEPECDSGIAVHFRILADQLALLGAEVHVFHPTLNPRAVQAALEANPRPWHCHVIPVQSPAQKHPRLFKSWPLHMAVHHLSMAAKVARVLPELARHAGVRVMETHATDFPSLLLLHRRSRPLIVTRVSTTLSQMIENSSLHSKVRRWEARLERHAIHKSDVLLTHTQAHRDLLSISDGVNPNRFHLIPHGIPDPLAQSQSVEQLPRHAIRFLFVGRFEERKGIDVLLEAIPEVANRLPHAHFTLAGSVGDKVAWNRFQQLHPDLAGSRVVALGRVDSSTLSRLYSECSVLVAPSRYESFGLVYVEAMARGKPVIGCNTGGIPEVVKQGETGLLAHPGDVRSLITAMTTLGADPELRNTLGTKGRKDFLSRFNATIMAEKSLELYTKSLQS